MSSEGECRITSEGEDGDEDKGEKRCLDQGEKDFAVCMRVFSCSQHIGE